jgi:hypothetical protein
MISNDVKNGTYIDTEDKMIYFIDSTNFVVVDFNNLENI